MPKEIILYSRLGGSFFMPLSTFSKVYNFRKDYELNNSSTSKLFDYSKHFPSLNFYTNHTSIKNVYVKNLLPLRKPLTILGAARR